MKKFLLSLFVIGTSAGYSLHQYFTDAQTIIPTATEVPKNQTETTTSPVVIETPTPTPIPVKKPTPTPKPAPTPTPTPTPVPVPAPTPAQKPKGQYVDGTYTGNAADAYYGLVQIQVGIQNGKLTTVTFLQYPNDRSTSRSINSRAMPKLQSEAIQAQSANVNGVSGASDTSAAFKESLADALAQAKT